MHYSSPYCQHFFGSFSSFSPPMVVVNFRDHGEKHSLPYPHVLCLAAVTHRACQPVSRGAPVFAPRLGAGEAALSVPCPRAHALRPDLGGILHDNADPPQIAKTNEFRKSLQFPLYHLTSCPSHKTSILTLSVGITSPFTYTKTLFPVKPRGQGRAPATEKCEERAGHRD